jgi:hypothetical protein
MIPPKNCNESISFKETGETVLTYLKVVMSLSGLIGAIILVIYCSQISYLPSGISIGDSLFLLAIFLKAGFSYIIFLFFCFVSTLWGMELLWKWWGEESFFGLESFLDGIWLIGISLFFTILYSGFAYFRISNSHDPVSTLISVVGFFIIFPMAVCAFRKVYPKVGNWGLLFLTIFLIFSPILIRAIPVTHFVNNSMESLGIKSNDVSIILPFEE